MTTYSDSANQPPILLDERHNRAALATEFRKSGCLHMPDFLDEDIAVRLNTCLVKDVPWEVAFLRDGKPVIGDARAWDQMPPQEKAEYLREVMSVARDEFQYFYDSYRVEVAVEAGVGNHLYLHRFYEFMNSEPLLEFMREITGMETIAFADGQATRFRPGSFLTDHNDMDTKKGRLCAYVMNLTPEWKPDWGGILNFYDEAGNVSQGFTPRFNTLNLLRVPQPHAVSFVPPFAGAHRLSVTGWLRETT